MLLNNDFDPNLKPDYLSNWEDHQIKYYKGEPDDDGQFMLWHKLGQNRKTPIIALSELMIITGPEKSRKSFLQSCILMSKHTDNVNRTMGFEMEDKTLPILHFDTEQPKRRCKKNFRRYHEACGLETWDKKYRFLSIKSLNCQQKLDFITDALKRCQDDYGVSPGFLVIDQIADLAPGRDVNDDIGANMIIDHINSWQEMAKEKMVISAIIHTNRGRENTNGKLGSLLDKKSDCMFHVDIEYGTWVSTVTHKLARDNRIPKFTFRHDYDGYPALLTFEDESMI